jgi:hypothetical protein
MNAPKDVEKLRYRLNLILIALLCSTTLAPCVLFFVRGAGEWTWLATFIAISYLVSRIPNSFYDRLQFSTDVQLYQKLQVPLFKKLSTNGDLINKRIRAQYPTHRNVSNLETIEAKLKETYTIERSHTVLFVFCLMTNVYAFATNSLGTAILLFFGNLFLNFYPNLLQQYNRIRYRRALKSYS